MKLSEVEARVKAIPELEDALGMLGMMPHRIDHRTMRWTQMMNLVTCFEQHAERIKTELQVINNSNQ